MDIAQDVDMTGNLYDSTISYTENDSESSLHDTTDCHSDSSGDEGPQNAVDVGHAIIHAFHNEYNLIGSEDDGMLDENMLDVVAERYGADSSSELSSVYEELDFPANPQVIVDRIEYTVSEYRYSDISTSDEGDVSEYLSEDEDSIGPGRIGEEEEEEQADDNAQPINEGREAEGNITSLDAPNRAAEPSATIEANPGGPLALKETFSRLQGNRLPSKAFLVGQSLERAKWRVLELEEMQRGVQRELKEAIAHRESLSKELDADSLDFSQGIVSVGISVNLWNEYLTFCDSMEPEFGSTDGWSLACDGNHGGSYVNYDPGFALFKEYSETSWEKQNFRCEASGSVDVEFWPVLYPSADIKDATTWGDLYPALYNLAVKAARKGSEGALDMLVALPDRESSFKGGWLFEYFVTNPRTYKDEGILTTDAGFVWMQDPVQSRRWHYRSAHRVSEPEDANLRRQRIQSGLKPAEHVFRYRLPGN
ncbi:hypothetical protein SAMD00023353_7500070 [Rosellinia necatrix]|uniref:Uncharacterized protein n=1 Tax=Rosellinia necatrix TaxID=77044 RepID=A0A1W2TTJ5_ROSNE|nr:hypothetical protein SAMD00023353_7500070 [Rosellinia necatrix]